MLDRTGGVVLVCKVVVYGIKLDLGFHGRLGFGYRALTDALGVDARHVSGCDSGRCDYETSESIREQRQ